MLNKYRKLNKISTNVKTINVQISKCPKQNFLNKQNSKKYKKKVKNRNNKMLDPKMSKLKNLKQKKISLSHYSRATIGLI